jgi:hypothetical protein
MSQPQFRNRIVGSEMVAPDQLLANPLNWRIHPRAQQDAMEAVLDEIGWIQDVIVNKRTGRLIDGHMRVMIALRRNELLVPVEYVDLDEHEEALALATFDHIGSLAVKDESLHDALLDEIDTDSPELQELLGIHNALIGGGTATLEEAEKATEELASDSARERKVTPEDARKTDGMVRLEFVLTVEERDRFYHVLNEIKRERSDVPTLADALMQLVNDYIAVRRADD